MRRFTKYTLLLAMLMMVSTSFADGYANPDADNVASGNNSSAIGNSNYASGLKSQAIGWGNNRAVNWDNANGEYITSERFDSGDYSSALGFGNKASSMESSAVGDQNTATGVLGSAFGAGNVDGYNLPQLKGMPAVDDPTYITD